MGNNKSISLGAFLLNIRTLKKLTLREVEEETGKTVSNAYLSQLENNKITKPSPNILYALSQVFAISYEELMERAGYIVANINTGKRVATFVDKELTPEEENALLEYLAFLRSQRGK